jgi:hypothetical protein
MTILLIIESMKNNEYVVLGHETELTVFGSIPSGLFFKAVPRIF